MEKEDTEKYVKAADEVLKGIEKHIIETGGSKEGKGNVTMGTVRKTLDLAKNSNSFPEFKLRLGFMVARNMDPRDRNSPLERYYNNLINVSKGNLDYLNKFMSYVIMRFTVLAKRLE